MKPNRLLAWSAILCIGLLLLAAAACQERPAPPLTPPLPVSPPATSTPPPVSPPATLTPAPVSLPATATATPPPALPTATKPPIDAAVTGSVTYGKGAALPAGAALTVELRDVSRADAPSILITRQVIPHPGPPPTAFRLDYRRAAIDPRNTYSVSARVETAAGKLLFINDTAYLVLTYGHPDRADLELIAVE